MPVYIKVKPIAAAHRTDAVIIMPFLLFFSGVPFYVAL